MRSRAQRVTKIGAQRGAAPKDTERLHIFCGIDDQEER